MLLRLLVSAVLFLGSSLALADVAQTTNPLGTIDCDGAFSVALDIYRERPEGSFLYTPSGHILFLSEGLSFRPESSTTRSLIEINGDVRTSYSIERARGEKGILSGTRKVTNGGKDLPVSIPLFAQTRSIVAAHSDYYEIHTTYLQFLDQSPFHEALNAFLKKAAADGHELGVKWFIKATADLPPDEAWSLPWFSEVTPLLIHASNTLVSIRVLEYANIEGARPYADFSPENYAWVKGKLVPLEASDIVPPKNWDALRNMCMDPLKAQKAPSPETNQFNSKNPPNLNFTDQGLLVSFNETIGTFVVCLPYASVKSLIAKDSPIRQLIPK